MKNKTLTTLAFLASFAGCMAGCSAARVELPDGTKATWGQVLTDTDVTVKKPDGTEVTLKRTSKGEGVLRKLLGLVGGLF